MSILKTDASLTIKGKQINVKDLLSHLTFIPAEYLVKFLQKIGLNVPRKMRMDALKVVLRSSVNETIEERKTLADEMGYRLTWFSRYTDTQLVNLLEWYKSPSLSSNYLEQFWLLLLSYLVEKKVHEDELDKLFNQAKKSAKANELVKTKEFNDLINVVLYDDKGEIDGVTLEQFRPVTYRASTLTELRSIGDKYNAPIPKRLRKKELLEVIFEKLKDRGEHTPELEAELKKKNILILERFAKDNHILVSTELKKEEIIEYILSNAEETREVYFVPSSSSVYDEPQPEITKPAPEVKKPEPVVEKEEPVVEEEVVEEPAPVVQETIQVVSQPISVEQIDYRNEFNKLATAFESLAESFANKEFVVNVNVAPVANVNQEEKKTSLLDSPVVAAIMREDDFPEGPMTDISTDYESTNDTTKVLKTKIKRPMYRPLLNIATFFAVLSLLVYIVIGVMALPFVNQLGLIRPYIDPLVDQFVRPYVDLNMFVAWHYIAAGIAIGLINLMAIIRFSSKKVGRLEVFIWGILEIPFGFVVTGLFAIIASFSVGKIAKGEVVVDKDDQVGRVITAINELGDKFLGKIKGSDKPVGSKILNLFAWLIVLAALAGLILFAIWRLEFTYGYENIQIIGPWLRDTIIKPIFGSAHDMARYY